VNERVIGKEKEGWNGGKGIMEYWWNGQRKKDKGT
jgi:hypothetical protein